MERRSKKAETTRKEVPKTYKNSIGMEFVLIPLGSFMMGSYISPDEVVSKYGGDAEFFKHEHPQHKVTIRQPFYFQTTAVTQGQWEKVMGDNPSKFKDSGDDCPVEMVSWEDTQKFIDNLNGMEGSDKFIYRLPTEAEWEYACRAGTNKEFSFGDDASKLAEYAWYIENSEEQTHQVGTKKPNPCGLYDMHGNVWEWCQDWYGSYNSEPVTNPQGPDNGAYRVVRGGSWDDGAHYCRSALRGHDWPDYRNDYVGFRLSRSVTLGP